MTTKEPGADATGRFPLGIAGLDAILNGGVFRGGIYIVQGTPGSGKTILGNQICFNFASRGGSALYVTLLAETHARMLSHLSQMSFFDAAAVPDRVSYLGAFRVLEDEGLKALLDLIRREVRGRKAGVVVLDGMATVGQSVSSDLELKKFVHELQTQAVFSNCTMFLLTNGSRSPLAQSPEYTMVDGLMELRSRMVERRSERLIQVHKLRGSDYLSGEHSFRISEDGILVFPRMEALLTSPALPERADVSKVSSGVESLDRIMDGGPCRSSVTVVLGPAGSGKTTLGMQFLGESSAEEPGLFVGLNESPSALHAKTRALGFRLSKHLETGEVGVLWQPGGEGILDELCQRVLDVVRARKVRRLFIDSVEGFERFATDPLRSSGIVIALCNELRALGVTTFITAETELAGVVPGQPLAGLALKGMSPIAENILIMRLAAVRSKVHRLITVIKARDSNVDMRMRRFEITPKGLVIEDDFASADAVLGELSAHAQLLPGRATDTSLGRV